MPRVDPAASNGQLGGLEASIDELWTAKVRSDRQETFGAEVTKNLREGMMGRELEGFASEIPKEQSGVHPHDAYLNGFLKPLRAEPLKYLKKWFINYDPSTGHAGFNQDDAWGDYLGDADKAQGGVGKGAEDLTFEQRVSAVKQLVGGYTDESEGERVIQIFDGASKAERPRLYEAIEGHAWSGDWVEGWLVADDNIWNALSRSQLKRLRTVLNGG